VVETVFNLPGLGRVLIQAVGARDYPVVQGSALITALCVVLISTATEIATRVLDPRVGDA
jgi:peptide/nickel transport system permease protein